MSTQKFSIKGSLIECLNYVLTLTVIKLLKDVLGLNGLILYDAFLMKGNMDCYYSL